MSVSDYRVGNAPHERPSQRSKAAATYDYQSGSHLLSEVHYLRIRIARPRMGFCDLAAHFAYLLHLLLKSGSSSLLSLSFHPTLQIRVERDSSRRFVENAEHASYIEDMQCRIGTLSQVCGSGRGQVGILRAVGR